MHDAWGVIGLVVFLACLLGLVLPSLLRRSYPRTPEESESAMRQGRIIAVAWLIGLAVVGALLAGCGSSLTKREECSSMTVKSEHDACLAELHQEEGQPTEVAASAEPPEEVGGPLGEVGTIAASDGEGTAFSEHYRLGPLLYSSDGRPPREVLDACNANYVQAIAESVYARGEVTITYTEGSLLGDLPISPDETVAGEGYLGSTAFLVDGIWQCQGPFDLSFEPGEDKNLPIWILAPVLSNAEPEVSEGRLDTWHFTAPEVPYISIKHSVSASGPHAAACESSSSKEDALFLYATPPIEIQEPFGAVNRCKAVEG